MITQSGVHIQKIGGVEGTPTATDIAVHAGRICRFGGAVWSPLLAHLIFVGFMAYRRSGNGANLLWGFLHDAHEAVTGEVPRPFKCDCMRAEQQAIDMRLYNRFMQWSGILVDRDLIKQCDIEACHIEAMKLGVPGFAEIEIKHSKEYTGATEIYDDIADKELFQQLRGSEFWHALDGMESYGVQVFAKALQLAENRQYNNLMHYVGSWGFGSLVEKTGYFAERSGNR
jgi:hypothetical protein